MKVVLRQDVKNIGKKDEIHEVSDGYGRNYLLPRGLAIEANSAAMNEVKTKEAAKQHHADMETAEARGLAQSLDGILLVMHAKAGQSGRLFGAITVKDIAVELKGRGVNIDKRRLVLDCREIKSHGDYGVEAKIHPGITAKFTVRVEE